MVMSYQVEFTARGIAGLEDLSLTVRERVFRKIKWMSDNFEELSHQGLTGNLSGLFKLRVGDYRLKFLGTCYERNT